MQFYTHEVQSTTYQHDEPYACYIIHFIILMMSYTNSVSVITINCNLQPLTS